MDFSSGNEGVLFVGCGDIEICKSEDVRDNLACKTLQINGSENIIIKTEDNQWRILECNGKLHHEDYNILSPSVCTPKISCHIEINFSIASIPRFFFFRVKTCN